jgi:hypothetical protein
VLESHVYEPNTKLSLRQIISFFMSFWGICFRSFAVLCSRTKSPLINFYGLFTPEESENGSGRDSGFFFCVLVSSRVGECLIHVGLRVSRGASRGRFSLSLWPVSNQKLY